MALRAFIAGLLWFAPAQEVRLGHELRRLETSGKPIAADRAEPRIEVLSPGVFRNAFATFLISVAVPAGMTYELHLAQNPDDAVKLTLYRNTAAGRLTTLKPPQNGTGTAGKLDLYWLDVFVPSTAKVQRVRVEAQVWAAGRWTIYPTELRIGEPVVPPAPRQGKPVILPPASLAAQEIAIRVFRQVLCEGAIPAAPTNTVAGLIARNAAQDALLVRASASGQQYCNAENPAFEPGEYMKIRRSLWR